MTCSRTQRLAYGFVGLVVGDAALLLYLLLNAVWVRAALLAAHVGQPYAQIPVAIQVFAIYAALSLVGWLSVGVPAVLLLPVSSITRWPWLQVVTLGAFLGPLAMVVILLVLGGGHIRLERTAPLLIFSILVSTVSFAVYVALLRKQFGDVK
jgi:hypothetical protein